MRNVSHAMCFARDVLCGSILQIADKAIELFSSNQDIPEDWNSFVHKKQAKYCIGRLVRSVPIGLIILAGRNQYTHFNDQNLHSLNKKVFSVLASSHGEGDFIDPAFDVENRYLDSYASNIVSLLGWEFYDNYLSDIRSLLEPIENTEPR